jgi:ABC-type polysaccharide/polyol phosphate export permease
MASSTAHALRVSRRPGSLELIIEGLRDIWSRRRLARYLVRADLHRSGADTLLGNVWWILDPLLHMLVYVILVTVIFKVQKDAYPLFVFCAILPWKWFTTAVQDGIVSVTSRERIIKQVAFPKLVLPFAATAGGVVSFTFGLIPMMALILLLYRDRLEPTILLLPVVAAVQFVFSLGFATALAATNVFFRDIANVSRHALRLWFYLSPGLYAYEDVASKGGGLFGRLLALNPWTPLFESYRAIIYDGRLPDWGPLAGVLGVSVVLLLLAILYFKRVEPAFAKVL